MDLAELLKQVTITLEEYEAGQFDDKIQVKFLYNMLCTVHNVLNSIGVE